MATELVTVHLTRDFETNGQVVPAGNHTVPKELAEDLMRRQNQYDNSVKVLPRSVPMRATKALSLWVTARNTSNN